MVLHCTVLLVLLGVFNLSLRVRQQILMEWQPCTPLTSILLSCVTVQSTVHGHGRLGLRWSLSG